MTFQHLRISLSKCQNYKNLTGNYLLFIHLNKCSFTAVSCFRDSMKSCSEIIMVFISRLSLFIKTDNVHKIVFVFLNIYVFTAFELVGKRHEPGCFAYCWYSRYLLSCNYSCSVFVNSWLLSATENFQHNIEMGKKNTPHDNG